MLNRIALLVDTATAAELVARLTASDLSAADPKLDLLNLNAALVPGQSLDRDSAPPRRKTFAAELDALRSADAGPKPPGWAMSPRAAVTYLMGAKAADGTPISAKYVGDKRLIETAVATLATDRALLLLGVPGTAKSWVSEHLAAATAASWSSPRAT
jgi:hypothetical protein